MATRDDQDLRNIKNLIEVTIDERIESKGLVTKDDIKHLPTKDEFYSETAKIYKKLDNLETEVKLSSNRVSEHSDDLEKLKDIHPDFRHAAI
ncbi:MAG: hypothetical protein UT39_C0023G0007 [Candidatus Woesebacteria bacterium GW2011_GWA1_39_21]|uniref:Uncharacterized protein n=1 Tax=Candidatus Woesebacteria bacterium GW2011_GWA1_39_21 TaxID=1618550 RepID=A0A0G0NBE2_9BACT|nr:MAG: hypothetical protein UT39_C0023G0007 [Candidatus Woesebacteria bacterium GW2011_GWA1_39_21]